MKSQKQKLYDLLSDGEPHRTDEIVRVVYGSDRAVLAPVASRVSDLRKDGCNIPNSKPDEHNKSLHWYRMILPEKVTPHEQPKESSEQLTMRGTFISPAGPIKRKHNPLNWR